MLSSELWCLLTKSLVEPDRVLADLPEQAPTQLDEVVRFGEAQWPGGASGAPTWRQNKKQQALLPAGLELAALVHLAGFNAKRHPFLYGVEKRRWSRGRSSVYGPCHLERGRPGPELLLLCLAAGVRPNQRRPTT